MTSSGRLSKTSFSTGWDTQSPKSGDLGYLDGYFVLAGIYYRAEVWVEAQEALAPLIAAQDQRALTMMAVIESKVHATSESQVIRRELERNVSGFDLI